MSESSSRGRRKCLLILPLTFYSFGLTLRKTLETKGMDVTIENDEFPSNILGKVMGKLGALKLLRRFTLNEFRRRYGNGELRFEVVVIIKGRGVGTDLIDFLRTISRRVVAYNFDSFRFNPSPVEWMHAVDRYSTFDIEDAKKHGLPLVHLFSALPSGMTVNERCYDISVLMKNHSQRLAYTDQVLSSLADRSHFAYIFEPNIFSFILGVLRVPRLYFKYWNNIHFKPMPYRDFLKVLGKSHVTIDYAHPSQTGITIRCFEARSLGVAIVTNNLHVFEHPFFDVHTATHFPLGGSEEKLVADVKRLLAEAPNVSLRSAADFMAEILDLPGSPALAHGGGRGAH